MSLALELSKNVLPDFTTDFGLLQSKRDEKCMHGDEKDLGKSNRNNSGRTGGAAQ